VSISTSDVQAKITAAVAAMESADYATALRLAIEAQGMQQSIPDARKEGQSYSFAGRADSMAAFIQNIRRLRTAAGGIRTTKITYARPS